MSTTFRALCADIVLASDAVSHDATAAEGDFEAAIDNARAALAQPEPVEPTDDALDELYFDNDAGRVASWRQFARAVLARWGTP
jgi:hypothetical protein